MKSYTWPSTKNNTSAISSDAVDDVMNDVVVVRSCFQLNTFLPQQARVSLTQSGSLSIFSSREQEYEQRAQLLKRLAYVIFCSEMDQYAKYMRDIQGELFGLTKQIYIHTYALSKYKDIRHFYFEFRLFCEFFSIYTTSFCFRTID